MSSIEGKEGLGTRLQFTYIAALETYARPKSWSPQHNECDLAGLPTTLISISVFPLIFLATFRLHHFLSRFLDKLGLKLK